MISIRSKRKFFITISIAATLAVAGATTTAFAAGRKDLGNENGRFLQSSEFEMPYQAERNAEFKNVPSPKKQTKNAGKKTNEKNDKYDIKLL